MDQGETRDSHGGVAPRTDQLVASGGTNAGSFAYDAFGNMTQKAENSASTTTTMAYADGTHLTSLTTGTGSAVTLAYDALWRTASRAVDGGATETYRYTGTSDTIDQISDGTTTRTSLIDATGSRLSWTSGGTTAWTLFDHLGSLVALVGAGSGNPLAEVYRYDGYGQAMRGTVQVSKDDPTGKHNPFRFRGALNLGSDGEPLYAMGARRYAPSAGAWTSMDTYAGAAQDPASMNRYLYVTANPTSLIDPTGHMAEGCGTWTSMAACTGISNANQARAKEKHRQQVAEQKGKDSSPTAKDDDEPWEKITIVFGHGHTGTITLAPVGTPEREMQDALVEWCRTGPAQCDIAMENYQSWLIESEVPSIVYDDATNDRKKILQYVHTVLLDDLATAYCSWDGGKSCEDGKTIVLVATAATVGLVACANCSVAGALRLLGVGGAAEPGVQQTVQNAAPQIQQTATAVVNAWGPTKPIVTSPSLRVLVEELYRRGATIGNGGSADAMRAGVGHVQKVADYAIAVNRWIMNNPNASPEDIHNAYRILADLLSAAFGQPYPGD